MALSTGEARFVGREARFVGREAMFVTKESSVCGLSNLGLRTGEARFE